MEDEQRWTAWLATEQCPVEQNRGRLQAALRQRCRSEGVEPPTEGQIERVVISAMHPHKTAFAAEIVRRLGPQVCGALQALVQSEGALAEVKADPGPLGLDTLMSEIAKLTMVRALKLPQDLFADVSDRLVVAWRSWAAGSCDSVTVEPAGLRSMTRLSFTGSGIFSFVTSVPATSLSLFLSPSDRPNDGGHA